jgi:Recombinase
MLREEGLLTKTGRPFDKGAIYKLLGNKTYLGEVTHKDKVYPGEHRAIVPRELWDSAHAVLQESPRVRANQNRSQSPALLRGLIFGPDGRAMSPTHTRRRGRLCRYYVSQAVLQGTADECTVRRLGAGEIEGAVMAQVRALLRQPEIVVGTWRAARVNAANLTESETRAALERLDTLWDELFPAEQARIVRLLVERVEVSATGADIRLRVEGLASLASDLSVVSTADQRAA